MIGKSWFLGAIFLGLFTFMGYTAAEYNRPLEISQLYQRNLEGTFIIAGTNTGRLGTAWLISDNLFVTAAHVVDEEDQYKIAGNDRLAKLWNVKIDYLDTDRDLAIFSMENWEEFKKFEKPVSLNLNVGPVQRGSVIWGIGNRSGNFFSFYKGEVSEEYIISPSNLLANSIRMTTSVIPGDSGGPVFDQYGNIVGLASQVVGIGTYEDGVLISSNGIIINAKTIENFVNDYLLKQASFNRDLRGKFKIDLNDDGLVITEVNDDFMSKELEIRAGDHDIILANQWTRDISNKPFYVQRPIDLQVFINMCRPGETISILLTRESGEIFYKELKIVT